jgi:hypothetical protein
MKRRHWIMIGVLALALALVMLLWLDAESAGDSQLCGDQCDAAECPVLPDV